MRAVCFTGHRPDKLGGYGVSKLQDAVRAALRLRIHNLDPATVDQWITGCALGVDQWAAEELVKMGLGSKLLFAVPFVGFNDRWPERSKQHLRDLYARSGGTLHIVCEPGYAAWKLQARNEWMVNNSTDVIAVWDGSPGGTANCVAYARSLDTPVHLINPQALLL